jgi:hypothetical protein
MQRALTLLPTGAPVAGRRALARALAAVAAMVVVGGCAGAPTPLGPPWTTVPIADFRAVAGKWEGTVTRAHGPKDDWLELTIRDDGSYEVVSTRLIGVMRGTGRFTLADGKLVTQGERGSATLALATRGPERRLDMMMRNREGVDLASTLTPKR